METVCELCTRPLGADEVEPACEKCGLDGCCADCMAVHECEPPPTARPAEPRGIRDAWRCARASLDQHPYHHKGCALCEARSVLDAALAAEPPPAEPQLRERAEAYFRERYGMDPGDPLSGLDRNIIESYMAFAQSLATGLPPTAPAPVAGRVGAAAEIQWRCGLLIGEEQKKPAPDQALIGHLREVVKAVSAAEPPPTGPTDPEATKARLLEAIKSGSLQARYEAAKAEHDELLKEIEASRHIDPELLRKTYRGPTEGES